MKKTLILSVFLILPAMALTIHAQEKSVKTSNGIESASVQAANVNKSFKPFVLTGTVVDEEGKPVPGARLYDLNYSDLQQNMETISGANGKFRCETVMPPMFSVLYAMSPDGQKLGMGMVRLDQDKDNPTRISPLTVILYSVRIITGRVVDSLGKPVAGALVAGCSQQNFPSHVRSGADGTFSFPYPNTQKTNIALMKVYAYKEGVGFDYHTTKEIDPVYGITPPQDYSDGPFKLTLQPFSEMKFRITDDEGAPIQGAGVGPWLMTKTGENDCFNTACDGSLNFNAFTDADGCAVLRSVPEALKEKTTFLIRGEEWNKKFVAAGRSFGSVIKKWDKLTKDAEGVFNVSLPKQAVTCVQVTLPDGMPVPGCIISRASHKACGHGIRITDANGITYLRENVGQYLDLAPESSFGAAPGVFAWDCGNGTKVKQLHFVLQKGIPVHGRVTRQDGSVPDYFSIFFYEKDPNAVSDTNKLYCDREGCAKSEAYCIRQTSGGKNESVDPERYEYILPAVKRTYNIQANVYPDEQIHFSKEITVNGDEKEITLDITFESAKKDHKK